MTSIVPYSPCTRIGGTEVFIQAESECMYFPSHEGLVCFTTPSKHVHTDSKRKVCMYVSYVCCMYASMYTDVLQF